MSSHSSIVRVSLAMSGARPARADDARLEVDLGADAIDDRVDEARVAEDEARPACSRRCCAHGGRGRTISTRGSLAVAENSASAETVRPGRDDAARVLAARRDDVEGRRRAEVDDDRALPASARGRARR
jgi:hypothetical protein